MKGDWLEIRGRLLFLIHRFFQERDFILADVPSMVNFPGVEVNIDFFRVGDRYLHPSPEIELKKIMAEYGVDRIYYLGHVFRDERPDSVHLPEFTMLEWYRAHGTLEDIKRDLLLLILEIAEYLEESGLEVRTDLLGVKDHLLPELFKERFGFSPCLPPDEFVERVKSVREEIGDYLPDDSFFSLYLEVEEKLIEEGSPFLLHYYPEFIPSLAMVSEEYPGCVKRFEFFLPPYEIANAYCELTGSKDYLHRFRLLNTLRRLKGKESIPVDEEFVALMDRFPPSSGIAVGVDRLLMALLGVENIRDLAFYS